GCSHGRRDRAGGDGRRRLRWRTGRGGTGDRGPPGPRGRLADQGGGARGGILRPLGGWVVFVARLRIPGLVGSGSLGTAGKAAEAMTEGKGEEAAPGLRGRGTRCDKGGDDGQGR